VDRRGGYGLGPLEHSRLPVSDSQRLGACGGSSTVSSGPALGEEDQASVLVLADEDLGAAQPTGSVNGLDLVDPLVVVDFQVLADRAFEL
jgi:hypothetical protein